MTTCGATTVRHTICGQLGSAKHGGRCYYHRNYDALRNTTHTDVRKPKAAGIRKPRPVRGTLTPIPATIVRGPTKPVRATVVVPTRHNHATARHTAATAQNTTNLLALLEECKKTTDLLMVAIAAANELNGLPASFAKYVIPGVNDCNRDVPILMQELVRGVAVAAAALAAGI